MNDTVLTGFVPQSETPLRDLFTAWLPQGYARMAQPVAMSTITTDTQGLVAGEVKIDTRDGPVPAYRALPSKHGKHPIVLVVQEIFGVHEHIKDVCRRLAKLGYFAIAHEPGKADPSRLGITGFCWGGRLTWTYCVHNPKVRAAVAWYGRPVAPSKAPLQPPDPG